MSRFMPQGDIMQAVGDRLRQRRDASLRERKGREAECEAADPRFAQIRNELAELGIKIARAAMSENGPDEIRKIALTSQKLQEERIGLLRRMGKPADYLTRRHTCSQCEDTGLLGAGRCSCADALLAEISAQRLNAVSPLALCRFEDFSLDYYSKEPEPVSGAVPYEAMSDILAYAKRYGASFSSASRSLLLWGRPGLGKTHIALAIAREAAEKGFSVAYMPAHQLFAALEREKFSRDEEEDTLSAVLAADLLVVDDLGTEFISAFVQSQLYTIVNTRLLTSRPTIVSTNLEGSELRERYPERLVSRLMYSYEDLFFIGKDIRNVKKYNINTKHTGGNIRDKAK